jgi:MYXO-CTERM domain-containing protein
MMKNLTPSRHRRARLAQAACIVAAAGSLAPNVALGATRFILSTFKSDAVPDEKLFIYDSTDGLNFNLLSATGYSGPSPGTLRDPSIIKYSDGRYYVAHTNPQGAGCCGKEDHFSIASSTDLVQWSEVTTVPGAIPNLAHVWAPEWFVDGSGIHIIANMDTGNADFQPYIFTALDASLKSWSAPVPMGIGKDYIDTFVLKVGSTYHAFVKDEATRFLEHATATELTGPWTFVGKADWAGWGNGMEGPSIVKLDDGTWRMFMDPQQAGFAYTDSKDLTTWSKRMPPPGAGGVLRHGTVIRDVALTVAEGGTSAAGSGGGSGGSNSPVSGGGPTAGAAGSINTETAGGGGLSGVAGSVVATAGSLSTGDSLGVGGNAGSAQVDSATVSPSADSTGCSCKTSAPSPLSSPTWLGALFAAAVLTLRRRYMQPSRIAPMA